MNGEVSNDFVLARLSHDWVGEHLAVVVLGDLLDYWIQEIMPDLNTDLIEADGACLRDRACGLADALVCEQDMMLQYLYDSDLGSDGEAVKALTEEFQSFLLEWKRRVLAEGER